MTGRIKNTHFTQSICLCGVHMQMQLIGVTINNIAFAFFFSVQTFPVHVIVLAVK